MPCILFSDTRLFDHFLPSILSCPTGSSAGAVSCAPLEEECYTNSFFTDDSMKNCSLKINKAVTKMTIFIKQNRIRSLFFTLSLILSKMKSRLRCFITPLFHLTFFLKIPFHILVDTLKFC